MRTLNLAPHTVAGLTGMALVAALFIANSLLERESGRGLGAYWLAVLLLPGVLAARLSYSRGTPYAESWSREAVLAGVIEGNLVAAVWVVWLAVGVATTNWAQYAQQVGQQVGDLVRDAALPVTIGVALVAVAVAYAGCVFAAWLGAGIYNMLHAAISRER
jgi:hypothetical protein